MMFSFSTCRLVLLVSAACSAMTSAELTVELGDAGHYAILAKTGIYTVPSSNIKGNITVSPIAATAMTGFGLTLDSSGEFSTSVQVLASTGGVPSSLNHPGHAFSASDAEPTPTNLTIAVGAMETAFTDAAGRNNTDAERINVGAGTLGGVYGGPEHQLTPGVYTFGSDVNLNGDVHFKGNGVYIIQIMGKLVQAANYGVILEDDASPENIFWQVAGYVEVGTGATMQGIILAKTNVELITGGSFDDWDEDNAGAIQLAKVPKMRPRTRHINQKYHHFREWVKSGLIDILPIDTLDQPADLMTKPLDINSFVKHRFAIMGW
jgi:hypothetical protein